MSNMIRLDGVDPNVTTGELKNLLSKFGSVSSRIKRSADGKPTYAVVVFKSPEDATHALPQINGMSLHGSVVSASFASKQDREWYQNKSFKKGRGGKGREREASSMRIPGGRGAPQLPHQTHPPHGAPHGGIQHRGIAPIPSAPPPPLLLPPTPHDQMPDITTFPFYFVQFETALDTPLNNIPFEVSVLKFTVRDGEIQHFHAFVDTGPLPHCYISDIIWRSEEVVGLPIGKMSRAEKNYRKLWTELCDFFGVPIQEKWTQEMLRHGVVRPHIYAKQPSKASQCLQWLCDKAGHVNQLGDVKPIEELIWFLFKRKKNILPPTSQVESYFAQLVTLDRAIAADTKCLSHRQAEEAKSGSRFRCSLHMARQVAALIRRINDTELR